MFARDIGGNGELFVLSDISMASRFSGSFLHPPSPSFVYAREMTDILERQTNVGGLECARGVGSRGRFRVLTPTRPL